MWRCSHLRPLARLLSLLSLALLSAALPSWLFVGVATAATLPSNTAPPTISGTAQDGDTLTATHGTWSGTAPISYSYRWSDGKTGKTNNLSAADIGQNISVTVTASNSAGKASATSGTVGPVIPAAPVNTNLPAVSGNLEQGDTLSVSTGTWNNSPSGYSYSWQDCDSAGGICSEISGATAASYTLQASDVGSTIRSVVTASNAGGKASATSNQTAVVVARGTLPTSAASTTVLLTSPNTAVTNENVTLISSVTSTVTGAAPSGTLSFDDDGTPINGCAGMPVPPSGQSVTVACQTSFAASTAQLTAIFTPSAGAIVAGSTSATNSFTINRDASSILLNVSNSVNVGVSTVYTVTVAPPAVRPGPVEPSGSVEFLDGGQPIGSCLNQELTNGGATCTVTYRAARTHTISARYLGDANFTGSTSLAEPVSAVPVPAHVLGTITSTLQWTFYYTRWYTEVRALVVNGVPNGATVRVTCRGGGCPFVNHATLVTKGKACRANTTQLHACLTHKGVNLMSGFKDGRLSVGTQIGIIIARAGWIGRYYAFTVRSGKGPRIQVACLAPGRTRPGGRCQLEEP